MQAASQRKSLPEEAAAPSVAAADLTCDDSRTSRKLEGTESKRHRHYHHHRDDQMEQQQQQQQPGHHNMSLPDAPPASHGGTDGPFKTKKHFEEWDWKKVMFAALRLQHLKSRHLARHKGDGIV